jgi:hypothetical protein
MTLELAAQVLTSALLLLQTVSANPNLPQSMRDQAQNVAQSAITEATRAIGKSQTSASCTMVSDKYNYRTGEVVVFSWTSTNATKLEFSQDSSDVFPVPEGELLGDSGQYRKVVNESGYPFLALKATGKNGESAICSAMVNVH